MRILSLILMLTVATLVDGTVTARLAIGSVMPDAFLVAALVWLSTQRGAWAMAGAMAIGLACDMSAASRLGAVTTVFVAAGALCAWFDTLRPASRFGRPSLLTAIALAIPLTLGITLKLSGHAEFQWSVLGARAAAVGAYSLALSLAITVAMRWCGAALGSRQGDLSFDNDRRATAF
ncbi:MAG: hypothetical protein AB7U73_02805 [Pirellulales bacterium]